MIIQGKAWGKTSPLFNNNNVEIHRLECERGGYSSEHKHEHKYNMFFVESGYIKVLIWKKDYDLIDETFLKSNDSCIIKPGEFHKFEVMENSVIYEIYWVLLEENDIVRKNCGGKGM